MKNEKVICDIVDDIPHHLSKRDIEYLCCDGRRCEYKKTDGKKMWCQYPITLNIYERRLLDIKIENKYHSNK